MDTVGAYEAKTHLSALLERVARGERIAITRHGVPIALLVPADEARALDPAEAIGRIRALRRGKRLGGDTIRSLIEEGRR